MTSISSFRADDPYEQLIAQMVRIESKPKFELQDQKDEREVFRGVLNDFDSKVSSLYTLLQNFTDPFSNPFDARSVEKADGGGYSVTASEQAERGSHTLEVERLAQSDTRVSDTFASADDALGQSGTFSFSVASPTDDDPDHRVTITVTVNEEDSLNDIRAAINEAQQAAVDDGTIRNRDRASVSVINQSADQTRLVMQSAETGYTHRLAFEEDPDGILDLLGINKQTASSGNDGGMIYEVGTGADDSELNSQVVLNGLTLYRDSNSIDDALEGVTLNVQSAGEPATTFTITADSEGIRDEVEAFVDTYNELVDYIREKSQVDPEGESRGVLAGDSTARGLLFGLRTDMIAQVSEQPADGPSLLADIGLELDRGGRLSLADEEALMRHVQQDAEAVRSFFGGPDGIATRMEERVDRYTGRNGAIQHRIDSTNDQIRRLEQQIETWEVRMGRREEQLRAQFAQFQEAIASLQGQQQQLFGFMGF